MIMIMKSLLGLDAPVSVQDSFIETDLHTKSTDKHQYLHTSFC